MVVSGGGTGARAVAAAAAAAAMLASSAWPVSGAVRCPGWVRPAGGVAICCGDVEAAAPGGTRGVGGDGAEAGAGRGLRLSLGLVWE